MGRLSDNAIEIVNELHTERIDYWTEYIPLIDALQRLAAYEDSGLTPERAQELGKAEAEGRVVVLPCKDWLEIVFGNQTLFYGIDTSYVENQVREISVDNAERFSWYEGWETLYLRGTDENGFDYEFTPSEVGATIFLTREEAESALAKMDGEDKREE